MGELKEGIWKSASTVMDTIGSDPSIYSRDEDKYCPNQAGLYPAAGLKNFGATCYLNVLIQVRRRNNLVTYIYIYIYNLDSIVY